MFLWLSMLCRCFFGFLCYMDVSLAFYVTCVSLAFYVTWMFLWLSVLDVSLAFYVT